MASRTALIFLTLNEVDGLRVVFDRIPREFVDEWIAMDGGSTDGTREFLEERGVQVVRQNNKGRGSAIIEGGARATSENVIFFSPDGNEDPRDIPKIAEGLSQGYSLVIASRFMRGAASDDSDDPLKIRRFGNRFFTALANLLFRGPRLTDAINGFRGMKRADLLRLNLDATQHEIEFQQSIRSKKLGYRILEIPTVERQRVGGTRKAKTWVMGFRFTYFLLREWWIGKRFLQRDPPSDSRPPRTESGRVFGGPGAGGNCG